MRIHQSLFIHSIYTVTMPLACLKGACWIGDIDGNIRIAYRLRSMHVSHMTYSIVNKSGRYCEKTRSYAKEYSENSPPLNSILAPFLCTGQDEQA